MPVPPLDGDLATVRRSLWPLMRVIVDTVLRGEVEGEPDPVLVDDTTRLLSEKLVAMPRYLGIGMVGATWTFNQWAISTAGRPFDRLPPEGRRLALARWQTSRFGLMRSFTDFYGKMGIFLYYSLLEERGVHP